MKQKLIIPFKISFIALAVVLIAACSKQKFEHTAVRDAADFPKQLVVDEEDAGDLEDTDKASFEIKLTDGIDPEGIELSGKPQVLGSAVTVQFELKDAEGFANWSDYILGGTAFYEVDDCTTSEDLGVDLQFTFDPTTGKGSVLFPAEVNSIELELELDPTMMDDAIENTDDRGFTFALTGIGTTTENLVINTDLETTFRLYDDEKVFGGWEADHTNASELSNILDLFTIANSDLNGLTAAEIDKIEVEFAFDEFKLLITLVETETIDDCGTPEVVQLEIELEGEWEELTDDAMSGTAHFIVEREEDNGFITEVEYEGSFERIGNTLTLTLTGSDGNSETNELTLTLTR
ncbi:hypothetical protein [Fluviicola sp.]|uniref:hypothetical protein n=1 Tax=Fluviicola sp. TaxID=1917219 RepID=UPI003D290C2D